MTEDWKPVEPNWKPIGDLAAEILEQVLRKHCEQGVSNAVR
jgi:hypothetical protein